VLCGIHKTETARARHSAVATIHSETNDTVEINNTFYNLPAATVFTAWKRQAPVGFVYALKASRYLTHRKKLKDPEQPLDALLTRARRLGPPSARSCTSCRRAGTATWNDCASSSGTCRATCATRSSSATRAGTATTCASC
jgi:hypothetical protein